MNGSWVIGINNAVLDILLNLKLSIFSILFLGVFLLKFLLLLLFFMIQLCRYKNPTSPSTFPYLIFSLWNKS